MNRETIDKTYMDIISTENSKFCIIALTGKVRAGTSDICKLLTDPAFADLATRPADTTAYDMSQIREYNIVHRYLHHNWRPFIHLSITDIIVSFILDANISKLKDETITIDANPSIKNMFEVLGAAIQEITADEVVNKAKEVSDSIQFERNWDRRWPCVSDKKIEEICTELSQHCKTDGVELVLKYWEEARDALANKEGKPSLNNFVFCFGYLSVLRVKIRNLLGKNNYTILFQKYGNNIRAYGTAIIDGTEQVDIDKIFSIPERVNRFIKMLRFYNQLAGSEEDSDSQKGIKNPVFIVINNFKNVFEAYYFKKRYSAFYLLAVSCDENMRKARFEDLYKFRIAELQENLSSGKRVLKKMQDKGIENEKDLDENSGKLGLNKAEADFAKEIYKSDQFLKNAYVKNTASFILQDVVTCVENADIFVTRDYQEVDYKYDYSLIRQLARIVTLILHPGLLTPTKIERCMQIAMTAKLNSGCLSRQVGAVVTDSDYNILSLGWNDAPCGAESCIRRNLYDLLRKHDEDAYSQYELYDEEFRQYLEKVSEAFNENKSELKGLPMAFCFKDIYHDIIKQRDQIYTRALHAEERALVSCDSGKAKGGYLFTTSSPCELCAKKAKDAEISKIYYIEQYPGIARSHIINYGNKKKWAKYELFVGAVGAAYVKLYTPVIPYKDELAILKFTTKTIHDRTKDKQKETEDTDSSKRMSSGWEQERQIQQDECDF